MVRPLTTYSLNRYGYGGRPWFGSLRRCRYSHGVLLTTTFFVTKNGFLLSEKDFFPEDERSAMGIYGGFSLGISIQRCV